MADAENVIDKHAFVNKMTVMIILMIQDGILQETGEAVDFVDKTFRLMDGNRANFIKAFDEQA
jgi:hypothetical protein